MRNEFTLYIDNIDHASIFRLKYHFPIFYISKGKNLRISSLKKKKQKRTKNLLSIQIMTDDPTRLHNVPRNREERTTGITSCQAIRPENHVATKITMYERADRDMQMKTVTGRTNHTGISRDPNR